LYSLQVSIADNSSMFLSLVIYRFQAVLRFREYKALGFLSCMMI
jgi:hypothetical protein